MNRERDLTKPLRPGDIFYRRWNMKIIAHYS